MEINENAPGNISQQDVTRGTDNETGHDPKRDEEGVPLPPDDDAPLEDLGRYNGRRDAALFFGRIRLRHAPGRRPRLAGTSARQPLLTGFWEGSGPPIIKNQGRDIVGKLHPPGMF